MCIRDSTHTHTHTLHILTHTHTHIHACMRAHTHTLRARQENSSLRARVHTHTHTHTHAHTHTRMHARAHIHTHIACVYSNQYFAQPPQKKSPTPSPLAPIEKGRQNNGKLHTLRHFLKYFSGNWLGSRMAVKESMMKKDLGLSTSTCFF